MVAVTSGKHVPKWKGGIAISPPGLIKKSGPFFFLMFVIALQNSALSDMIYAEYCSV